MIALRIIAGIVGTLFAWIFTFSICEVVDPAWSNRRRARNLFVMLITAFIFLFFALAGHL